MHKSGGLHGLNITGVDLREDAKHMTRKLALILAAALTLGPLAIGQTTDGDKTEDSDLIKKDMEQVEKDKQKLKDDWKNHANKQQMVADREQIQKDQAKLKKDRADQRRHGNRKSKSGQ